MEAGEPVTRVVTLTALGQIETQLPTIEAVTAALGEVAAYPLQEPAGRPRRVGDRAARVVGGAGHDADSSLSDARPGGVEPARDAASISE